MAWKIAATHRAIDATAALGAPLICLGLHGPLLPEQRAINWFWTIPGETVQSHVEWSTAVERCRELADHAARVGVEISLELYEANYLGTADGALRFLADIDRDNVGLNPDLGNLVRAQGPIEAWEAMAVKTLPHANYWHVKNYARAEEPKAGIYLPLRLRSPPATSTIDAPSRLRSPAAFAARFFARLWRGRACRVGREPPLSHQPAQKDQSGRVGGRRVTAPGVLLFDNIEKAFGGTQALKGVSFEVRRGEIVALLGETRPRKIDADQNSERRLEKRSGAISLDGAPFPAAGAGATTASPSFIRISA